MKISELEQAFYDFTASGYDTEKVPLDDISSVVKSWAIRLVPYYGVPTWQQQEMRRLQWPSIFARLTERISVAYYHLQQDYMRQKYQLIEARKEISRLKRMKEK